MAYQCIMYFVKKKKSLHVIYMFSLLCLGASINVRSLTVPERIPLTRDAGVTLPHFRAVFAAYDLLILPLILMTFFPSHFLTLLETESNNNVTSASTHSNLSLYFSLLYPSLPLKNLLRLGKIVKQPFTLHS